VERQIRTFLNTPRGNFHGEEYTPFSFIQATYNREIGSSSNLLLAGYAQYYEGHEESFWYTTKVNNWQYGLEGEYDFNFFKDHYMTIGSSWKYNDASRTKWELNRFNAISLTAVPSFSTYHYSVYFQDKYRITDNLELTAGVRFDEPEDYDSSVSPRVGISWSFWNDFNLKLLYGRAFRTPSRFLVINETNLDTEKIESWEVELGYRYREILSLKCNFFYNKLKDIIEEVAFGVVRNRGRDHINGIEFSASYQPIKSLSFYTDITYLFNNRDAFRSEFTLPGPELSEPLQLSFESSLQSPRGMFHWGLNYKLSDFLTTNLHFSYYMKRELGENPFYARTGNISPYFLMDVNIFFRPKFDDRLEMSLRIRNATKETYSSRGRYSVVDGAGRGFLFSIQYKF
jgi:outer membrane receptor protein involved in Fe transport